MARGSARSPRCGHRRPRRRAARRAAHPHGRGRGRDERGPPSAGRGADGLGEEPRLPRTRGCVGIEGRGRHVHHRACRASSWRRISPRCSGARRPPVHVRAPEGPVELPVPGEAAGRGRARRAVRTAGGVGILRASRALPRVRRRPPRPAIAPRSTTTSRTRRWAAVSCTSVECPGKADCADGGDCFAELARDRAPGGVDPRREPRALLRAPRIRRARAPRPRRRDHRRGALRSPRTRPTRSRARSRPTP